MSQAPRQFILPLYFLSCLLLGGSTLAPWPNMLLQLGGVAILGWAALARPRYQAGRPGVQLAVIIGAMIGVVVLQLVPLPPSLWSALTGRESIAQGFDLLRHPRPWLPLSLAPYETLTSALWLLPPLAILAGVIRLDALRDAYMASVLMLAAFVGVILGALQLAGSGDAAFTWYFYSITSRGAAVGFFANANHMAIFLVATVPFVVAMYNNRRTKADARQARASAGKIAVLGGAIIVLLVGIALNGSLAGVALGAVVAAASMFIRARFDGPRARWALAAVCLAGLVAIAGIIASPVQNNLTGAGVEGDYSSRYTSFSNSMRAVADYFPWGSGLGSFAEIYPAYENPAWVDRWYVNHAHNDYLEIALETGLPGILLMTAFIVWWIQRTMAIWRAATIDYFARAATVASAAILLHSLVDFPLRMTSVAALFAYCIASMVGLRRRSAVDTTAVNQQGTRHLGIS